MWNLLIDSPHLTHQEMIDMIQPSRVSPNSRFKHPAPSIEHPYPPFHPISTTSPISPFLLGQHFSSPSSPQNKPFSSSPLTIPPLLTHPTPISRRHITPALTLLPLLQPTTRHTKYDEEQDGHCSRKANRDGFPMHTKVNEFVGVGCGYCGW